MAIKSLQSVNIKSVSDCEFVESCAESPVRGNVINSVVRLMFADHSTCTNKFINQIDKPKVSFSTPVRFRTVD